jgi:hypothetical protein
LVDWEYKALEFKINDWAVSDLTENGIEFSGSKSISISQNQDGKWRYTITEIGKDDKKSIVQIRKKQDFS